MTFFIVISLLIGLPVGISSQPRLTTKRTPVDLSSPSIRAPHESVPALNPSTARLAYAGDRWVVWTQREVDPRSQHHHVLSYWTRCYLQQIGADTATFVFQGYGVVGPAKVLTVLEDGTILLKGYGLVWLPPGKVPVRETLDIDGRQAVALEGWPDGILVQEYSFHKPAPAYFVAITNGRLDLDHVTRITDDEGVRTREETHFARHGNQIAWCFEDTLHSFDLMTERLHSVKIRHSDRSSSCRITLFDGETAFIKKYKIWAYSLRDGKRLPYAPAWGFIATRNRIGYRLIGVGGPDGRQPHFYLDAVDLQKPGKPMRTIRLLAISAFKLHDRGFRTTDYNFAVDGIQYVTKEGLMVWDGQTWIHVPWLKKWPKP